MTRVVLVGAGAVGQEAPAGEGDDEIGLMAAAVRAAVDDAGAPALLRSIGLVAVPRGTWRHDDPGALVAARLGIDRPLTVLAELGVPQQTLVSDAIRRVHAGEVDVAVVVGGEAKRREVLASRSGVTLPVDPSSPGSQPDVHLVPTGELVAASEVAAKAWDPVQQYALMECARRRALGHTLDEHRDEISSLWAACNEVATTNPRAAFPTPRDAAWLREPSPENRPLAFPYNKWHSTQWTVDQAAALVICSEDAARAAGVEPRRCARPLVALESSFALSLSKRAEPHRWPAMRVLGDAAVEHLGAPLDAVGLVELYSCFPVAVRVQRDELGIDPGVVPTVTGGMAFAGGPFNNFTYQATVAVLDRLRTEGGLGLVSTVSGLLTKPGLMVWGTAAEAGEPLVADLGDRAAAATEDRPAVDAHRGPATVVTYTVTYDGLDPTGVLALAETPDGARCVARRTDADLAALATRDDLVGAAIGVDGATFDV